MKQGNVPDYKIMAAMDLVDVCNKLPDYTMGDILYSALQRIGLRHGVSMAFLREVRDDEFSQAVSSVYVKEYENRENKD